MKKYFIRALTATGLIILYLFIGVVVSYIKQPEINEDYIDNFSLNDYYSDEISCDRAYIIEDNSTALIERLRMIERANEKIILSTFDFKSDNSGKDILASLLNAAEQGVEVKILIDGYSANFHIKNDEYFMALSSNDNVEIKIYNAVNILKPWKSMGRLHDKYMIIDHELYILGGRNTHDYFLSDNGYKNHDRDVLVYNTEPDSRDSSINDLYEYFDAIWSLKECKLFNKNIKKSKMKMLEDAKLELKDIYHENIKKNPQLLADYDYTSYTYEVNTISILTNPIHIYAKEPTLFYSLTQLMNNADKEVSIHTPYIICNDYMYDEIASICKGSADVKIMTNSPANNANPFGVSDYLKHKDDILGTGVSLYEYEGGISYHGKSIVIDDNISIVGSFNMDMRSAYLNTEIMLVIDSKDLNKQLKDYMQGYEEKSVKILDNDKVIIPEGVVRQELTFKDKALIGVILLFNWLRFLM